MNVIVFFKIGNISERSKERGAESTERCEVSGVRGERFFDFAMKLSILATMEIVHGNIAEYLLNVTPERDSVLNRMIYSSKELFTTILPVRDGVSVSLKL